MKIGHAHLKVSDLEQSVTFYQTFFGLEITEMVASQFAFMSGGDMHHELALQQVPIKREPESHLQTGLYHIAFEVADYDEFARAYYQLSSSGVQVTAVDHGISWAMYFSDPDEHGLEIYLDRRHVNTGRDSWKGRSSRLNHDSLMETGQAVGV